MLDDEQLPKFFIPLSTLPLTSSGDCDLEILLQIPVMDEELIKDFEKQFDELPGVKKAAALIRHDPKFDRLIHLSDLLPNWSVSGHLDALEASDCKAISPDVETPKEKPLAISDGGALILPKDAPAVLGDTLFRAVEIAGNRNITYYFVDNSEEKSTYARLMDSARSIFAGLKTSGLRTGTPVIFQFENNRDFLESFWACILGGFVPVPMAVASTYRELNSAVKRLGDVWHMLGQPPVLTSADMVPEIEIAAGLLESKTMTILDVSKLQGESPDNKYPISKPEDIALIMLTSGSTGAPKGVPLTHRNLVSRSISSQQVNRFDQNTVSLNWMPLDHVASIIYFHLRDVFLGCEQIHVSTERILQEPLLWLDLIERYRATVTFGPNFAFGLVCGLRNEIAKRKWDLSSMRLVLNGGEAVVAKTARQFLTILEPHGLSQDAMCPAWGMSEMSSGITYAHKFQLSSTSDEDRYVQVGPPIPGNKFRIVDNNEVIKEGEIGSLQVKGITVFKGYYKSQELSKEAFTTDGWFKTGDLGKLDNGSLTITGREKEIIIINGVNYAGPGIEAVVEDIEGVIRSNTAACAVPDPGKNGGEALAIFFCPESQSNDALKELLKEIRNQVVKNIGISPEFLVPLSPVDIPKTSIGKIQRSKLQKAFAEDRFREELKRTDVLSANSNTIPAWFFSRGWQKKSRAPGRSLTKNDCVLIFGERTDITQTLERLLFSRGTKHIFIEQSKNFCRLSDKRYSLRPDNEEDYKKLFNSLATEGHKSIFAIHLWNFSYESCFDFNESFYQQVLKSCLGLTALLQGFLNADKESNAFTLAIVTNNAQKVLSGDDVDCSKASLLGLGKAISQENSDLKYLHIDMDVTGRDEDAEKIIAELESERLDRDIAYRKGHRMIPLLKQTEFLLSKETKSALQKGGCYLLSGGLGGIGRNIANYLLQEFRAHVIIIGRSPIFRGGQNKEESGYHDSDKLSEYHRLKSLPGEVAYLEADIGNRAELKKKIDDILSGWNKPLDGIFHLAGTYHERNVADETEDTLKNILYPKVMGAIALASLIEDHPDAFMVAFSSVTSIFSGATVGGYTAANQFLDAFFQQNMDNGRRFTVLNWATWQNTGMSLQYGATEPLRAMGIMDLPVEQALQSLRVALHQPPGQLIIGLDASKPYIQRHLSSLIPLEQIDVYYQQEDEVQKNSLLTLSLRDRYETSCDYRLNRISSVPLKDDGEVDHSKLLKIVRKGQLSKSRASTDTEKILTGIWQQILKVDDIDIDESFFELGGQSLMATQLIGSISDCFSIDLTLRDIFENPSIAQQGKIVDSIASKCSRTTSTDIQIISRTQVLPLSSPQKRMWFIDRLIPMNPVFNNSFTINFSKPVDILALENSLNQVIRRHETLRTVFPSVEGVPRQKILSELKAILPVIDLRSLSAEKSRQEVSRLINEEGRKPFDLKKGPLMRANLFILNESEYIFLVTIHHIITDGWSMAVFFEEVLRIYKAFQEGVKATLAELPVQYVDYSHWQSSSIQKNVFESQLGYWKEQLKGITTGLELSTDQPRPDVQTFRGNQMIVTIPLELSDKIKQLCQKNDVTLFMWLLASYKVFLCQYTEQTDVVIGTVTANRNRPEVKNLIGLFINVVVLRTNLSGNPTFLDCLQKVKKVTLDAYENQDLPFEMLIEELQPQRDLSRAPLFQLAFDLRNENVTRSISEDINFVEHYTGTAKYDLHLTIEDEGNTNELACIWEYATDIFNDSTISKIAGNFLTLLKNITLNPEMFIDELLFLSSSEHRHILEDWNDNSREEWLDNKCVHQLVEEQVDLNPMAIAVMYNNNMLTYGVLEKKANQLSRYLKSIDVGPS